MEWGSTPLGSGTRSWLREASWSILQNAMPRERKVEMLNAGRMYERGLAHGELFGSAD